MRHSKDPNFLRLQMARFAQQHGIKPAAHAFATTPKTVRKWFRRWQAQGYGGLQELSRAPHHPLRRIRPAQRHRAIQLKRQLPSWGAARLKRDYQLRLSEKALRRIRHQEGLLRRKRRKHRVKRDLRAVKAAWRLWEQIDLDTKDLDDIPQLWPQIRRLGLPLIQHTARETGWKNPTALITWSWKWSPAKLELSASSTMKQSPLRKHYALLVAIDCWLDY